MECLNCKLPLKETPSKGIEGKYLISDLEPFNEQGYRPVKDGIVVELYYCSGCGLVYPKLPKSNY